MAKIPPNSSASSWLGTGLQLAIAVLAYTLVTLPWERELSYGFKRVLGNTSVSTAMDEPTYTRTTLHFSSVGDKLEGWLYLPKHGAEPNSFHSEAPFPVVIMAHGLGAQKDFGLHKYADHFASSRLAVLVFDYRSFGGSEGEPRQWVSPARHNADWAAAVRFVQDGGLGDQVDRNRIALWGTSFAGGHVLVTAATFGSNIKAVIAQVPHLDGLAASKSSMQNRGVLGTLRMAAAGLHDYMRSCVGLSGAYVKLVGGYSELAFMQLGPEELQSYFLKHPKNKLGGWQPRALARFALESSGYSPINYLGSVTAPVMFVTALKDSLCNPELIRRAADLLKGQAELHEYDTNHFDIYLEPTFSDNCGRMTEFLHRHLQLPQSPASNGN